MSPAEALAYAMRGASPDDAGGISAYDLAAAEDILARWGQLGYRPVHALTDLQEDINEI